MSLLAIASLLPGLEEKFWLLSEGLGWGLARRERRVAGTGWLYRSPVLEAVLDGVWLRVRVDIVDFSSMVCG